MSVTQNRLYFLDSIRGIAAIMVASSHFVERTPLHELLFFKYVNLGQIGVVTFFILSGMVIPFSLKSGERPLLCFFISRFFRLYPAYWFSVLLAVVTAFSVYRNTVGGREIIINMTMFQSLFGVPDLFGVYWTLIIEVFFYITCALLFIFNLLSNKNTVFLISLGMLGVSLVFALLRFYMHKKIPVAIPLCMSLMFFGSLWRPISLGISDKKTNKAVLVWLMLFSISLLPICFLAYNRNFGHGENALSYIVSYTMGVVFTLLLTTKLKIKIKFTVFLGTISYSIYLVHQLFLEVASTHTDMAERFNPLVFIAYLIAVVLLAVVAYYCIEKPAIALGNKVKTSVNRKANFLVI